MKSSDKTRWSSFVYCFLNHCNQKVSSSQGYQLETENRFYQVLTGMWRFRAMKVQIERKQTVWAETVRIEMSRVWGFCLSLIQSLLKKSGERKQCLKINFLWSILHSTLMGSTIQIYNIPQRFKRCPCNLIILTWYLSN